MSEVRHPDVSPDVDEVRNTMVNGLIAINRSLKSFVIVMESDRGTKHASVLAAIKELDQVIVSLYQASTDEEVERWIRVGNLLDMMEGDSYEY